MIALYTLTSQLHKYMPAVEAEPFITSVEAALGEKFVIMGDDFSTYGQYQQSVIYVRTGGTEGIFKSLGLSGEIRLLTSGKSNSLAAAMEILSYIRSQGGTGEILHGGAGYIAGRLRSEINLQNGDRWIRALPPVNLGGARLGVIGHPSDWLISSDVDYSEAASRLNAELVDIDISELVEEIGKYPCNLRAFEGSEAIHKALCSIAERHNLSGLTLRCFDLLDTVGNTGCLALARLNAAGIPSSCEGDIPALISMMIANKLTGCPGFQCNLSRIEGDGLLFAHCTVPLSMVSSYKYDTHFESGIGTAIKGEIPEGEVTIFKVSPDLHNMVAIPAKIIRNTSENWLCRTQVVVEAHGAAEYFLNAPLANHHVIIPSMIFQDL